MISNSRRTGAAAFIHMSHEEPEPDLVLLDHPNELDPGLAILCPPYYAQIDAHRTFGIDKHSKLDNLAGF